MIDAAAMMLRNTSCFKKGFDDGQRQQLSGQRQEESKDQGLGQAGAEGSWEEEVNP